MSYLEQIKSLKFKISKVTVDGVDFYLRELSGKARLDFENEKDLQLRRNFMKLSWRTIRQMARTA